MMLKLESRDSLVAGSFLGVCQSFFLLRPSTDWMRPTHIIEGSLLYPESADLNVNLDSIKKKKNAFTETPRIIFDSISGYHGLSTYG